MVKTLAALGMLAGAGWYLLRPGNMRAFGESGIPYAPSERAFGDAGVPFLGSIFKQQEREAQTKDPLDSIVDTSWLDDLFPTDQGSGISDIIDGSGSIFDMVTPRGIRNNNPGNIEYTGTQWKGLDNPPSDGRFMRFTDAKYGIRALARVLDTYRSRSGIPGVGAPRIDTVQEIISRWAPSFENDVSAYAEHVAGELGVSPTQPIDVMARRAELVAAIIEHENGQQPYSWSKIRQGVALA